MENQIVGHMKNHTIKSLLTASVALYALYLYAGMAEAAQCWCQPKATEAAPASADAINQEALEYINAVRSERGLSPMRIEPLLVEVAIRHSQWLTDNNKDTEHYKELEWASEKGFGASHAGVYSVTDASVRQVIDAWLNSDSGHANLIIGETNDGFGLGNVTNDWTIVVSIK